MVSELFAQFIKEKRYIANFSERTIQSYEGHVFKRWVKYVGEMPTQANLTQFVIAMRGDRLSPTTCNITIRSFNSFLAWLHGNGLRRFNDPSGSTTFVESNGGFHQVEQADEVDRFPD